MEDKEAIIERVSAFMSLCLTITTSGSTKLDGYVFKYQELRSALLTINGLWLPLWISASTTPASVLAHVKMEQGSGNGAWQRRRDFFQQEKMKIIGRLSTTPEPAVDVAPALPCPTMATPAAAWLSQPAKLSASTAYLTGATDNNLVPEPSHYQPVLTPRDSQKKVFIVHGHDHLLKYEVARLVEEQGFKSIIFHEQRIRGTRTIIDKLVALTQDVDFAVVLYTPCDSGQSQAGSEDIPRPRARQNVVFEHGFLLATLGPDKVMALKDPAVEFPSDLDGVLYISTDNNWKYELAEELRALS